MQHTHAMTSPSAKEATTRTINVRLPASVYEQLEDLAKATSRTKSFVTLEALTSYLNEQSWQIGDIEAAIAEGATFVRVGTDIFGARPNSSN